MIHKNIVSLDHIALQLPSLAEGMQFFNGLLGFKVKFEATFEGHKIVMLKAGKVEIEMWEGQPDGNPSLHDEDPGVHHVAFQVKNLEAVLGHMKEQGVQVLVDIYEPTRGLREAIVLGPGEVRVQFVEQNLPLLIWRTITGDFKEN